LIDASHRRGRRKANDLFSWVLVAKISQERRGKTRKMGNGTVGEGGGAPTPRIFSSQGRVSNRRAGGEDGKGKKTPPPQ